MKIATDHGFPKGTMPTDDAFELFKNERDYIAQGDKLKTTAAAMNWAADEIERLRSKLPAFRCDNCDNGVELEWEFCAWCGATKDWAPANQQIGESSK